MSGKVHICSYWYNADIVCFWCNRLWCYTRRRVWSFRINISRWIRKYV